MFLCAVFDLVGGSLLLDNNLLVRLTKKNLFLLLKYIFVIQIFFMILFKYII